MVEIIGISLLGHTQQDVEAMLAEGRAPGQRVLVDPAACLRAGNQALTLVEISSRCGSRVELTVLQGVIVEARGDSQQQVRQQVSFEIGIDNGPIHDFAELRVVGRRYRVVAVIRLVGIDVILRYTCPAHIGTGLLVEIIRRGNQRLDDYACNLCKSLAAGRNALVGHTAVAHINSHTDVVRKIVVDSRLRRKLAPISADEHGLIVQVRAGEQKVGFLGGMGYGQRLVVKQTGPVDFVLPVAGLHTGVVTPCLSCCRIEEQPVAVIGKSLILSVLIEIHHRVSLAHFLNSEIRIVLYLSSVLASLFGCYEYHSI